MGALQQQSKRYSATDTDTATATATAADRDTVTYTGRRYKSRADSSTPASITNKSMMPRRSILILALGSLLNLLLLLVSSADATPVFVDNPSLAQCKYSEWAAESLAT